MDKCWKFSTPLITVHMIGEDMELKKILDEHENFVKEVLKRQKEIVPMVIVSKQNKRIVNTLVGVDRDQIKFFLNKMSDRKPDWMLFLSEAYMEQRHTKGETREQLEQIKKTYEHGSLEMQFKMGNPHVSEVIIFTAYSPDGKLQRALDKKTMKNIYGDIDTFEGYLTINDVDRVFWNKG